MSERTSDLVVRAEISDAPAPTFAEVYRRFFVHVSRWVRALGVSDADRADLVQDVFVTVHRRLPDFRGDNLSGWLYKITRRRVRDFRRSKWFKVLVREAPVDPHLAIDTAGPEEILENKELADILANLLSRLPESQRVAFFLFEIDGYSGEEIARLQCVPINTVWTRIHKARSRLARSVQNMTQQRSRA